MTDSSQPPHHLTDLFRVVPVTSELYKTNNCHGNHADSYHTDQNFQQYSEHSRLLFVRSSGICRQNHQVHAILSCRQNDMFQLHIRVRYERLSRIISRPGSIRTGI